MNQPLTTRTCAVIGAGIAGLVAARRLSDAGLTVMLFDKAAVPGGRLSTRSLGDGLADQGPQYFRATDPRFRELAQQWERAGVVQTWGAGFVEEPADAMDGQPRYRGVHGMSGLAQHLVQGLDWRPHARLTTLYSRSTHWELYFDSPILKAEAECLLLTPPLPQALAILDASNRALPSADRDALERVRYALSLTLLVRLEGPSKMSPPGGVRGDGRILAWLADNRLKGISRETVLTLQATAAYSMAHWDSVDADIIDELLESAQPWLGSPIAQTHLKRWRYAQPTTTYPAPFYAVPGGPPLLLAGDAFGSPSVEGAALSGLSAADALLRMRNAE